MVYKVLFSCGCFSVHSGDIMSFMHETHNCPLEERGNSKHVSCQEIERRIIER